MSPGPGRTRQALKKGEKRLPVKEAQGETSEYLQNLIDYATAPIIIWDPAFRITRFNHASERLTGRTEHDVLGEKLDILFPKESREASLAQIKMTLEGGWWEAIEIPILTSEGRTRAVLWNSANILRGGRIVSTIAQGVDITELKAAEEARRQSEERSRRFYESGLVGIIYWNMDGVITDANDRFLEMTGYTRDELIAGKVDWLRMTPPEYSSLDEESVKELKETGVNRIPFEKEYFRKDGARIPVVIAGAMLDRERFNGVAFVLDITERKRAEEALRKSEAILNETGSIARIGGWEHDLITGKATWTKALYEIIEIESGPPPGPSEHLGYYPLPDRSILSDAYNHAVETGESFDLELRVYTARKHLIWARVIGRSIIENGRCIRMVGTFQDVTDRKLAEEKVAHLASFPEMNPNPVLEMNSSGRITFANAATAPALENLGLVPEPETFHRRRQGRDPQDAQGILGTADVS